MDNKYTISIPIKIDFEGNQMSPQTKTIEIVVKAESADNAAWRVEYALEELVKAFWENK